MTSEASQIRLHSLFLYLPSLQGSWQVSLQKFHFFLYLPSLQGSWQVSLHKFHFVLYLSSLQGRWQVRLHKFRFILSLSIYPLCKAADKWVFRNSTSFSIYPLCKAADKWVFRNSTSFSIYPLCKADDKWDFTNSTSFSICPLCKADDKWGFTNSTSFSICPLCKADDKWGFTNSASFSVSLFTLSARQMTSEASQILLHSLFLYLPSLQGRWQVRLHKFRFILCFSIYPLCKADDKWGFTNSASFSVSLYPVSFFYPSSVFFQPCKQRIHSHRKYLKKFFCVHRFNLCHTVFALRGLPVL